MLCVRVETWSFLFPTVSLAPGVAPGNVGGAH